MTRINALFARLALIGGVLLCVAFPAQAQTAIDNTTLSATMTATQQTVTIGSVTCTGCTVGSNTVIFVDEEAMCVNDSYVSGTTLPVTRGCLGTQATTHAINMPSTIQINVVFIGPANRFHAADPPKGRAIRTDQQFLPWISLGSGIVWTTDGYYWRGLKNWNENGTSASRATSY